jgi:4-amino-4-deoxy-L-arabinose transferase-like glycosyltransferase
MWLLFGILIIAIFLRSYHFTSTPPGLYPDEAADGNNAVQAAETNRFQVFYTEDNGREGLYVNLIAVFLKVWPIYQPWVIRLPAAIAGVLTVLGLYFLVSELFGFDVGLLAAFLLATSFWHIDLSRIGFRAILSPLFLTWALYLFIKALRAGESKKAWFYSIAAGIVYALGFYTYIAYRITPLLFLVFIPFFRKNPGFWKRSIIFIVATFIVATPIGLYFVQNPAAFFGRTSEIAVTNASNPVVQFGVNLVKTALMFNVHGDYNWRQNVSGAPELFFPVGLLFLLGIVLGLYSLIKKKIFPAFGLWLVFIWIALGAIPAAASNEGIPHALRSILMLPPALFLASLGGVWFYGWMKTHWNRTAAKTVAVIFIVAVAVFGYYDYFIVWAKNPNVPGAFNQNYVDLAHQINALPQSTPKYIVVNAGGVIDYGIPVPADTVMFLTHSFTPQDRAEENIHYFVPDNESEIPAGVPSDTIFYIN